MSDRKKATRLQKMGLAWMAIVIGERLPAEGSTTRVSTQDGRFCNHSHRSILRPSGLPVNVDLVLSIAILH